MLLENFYITQTREMMCDDAVLATVATYWNRNYQMIFSDNLSIGKSNSRKIVEFLQFSNNKNILLEKYHGIKSLPLELNTYKERCEIIIRNLEKKSPVTVFIKGKKIDWYQEEDYENLFPFIIVGINKNFIFALDIHLKKEIVKINKEVFFTKWKKATIYTLVSGDKKDLNWMNEIKSNLESLAKHDTFNTLREFSNLIFTNYNFENKINSQFIPQLCKVFKRICGSRNLYISYLSYLIEKHKANVPNFIIDELDDISNNWFALWGITYKNYLKNIDNITYNQIIAKIMYLASKEEKVYFQLQKLVNGEKFLDKPNNFNEKNLKIDIKKLYTVNLNNLFNNEAFAINIEKNKSADLTGFEQFLVIKEMDKIKTRNYILDISKHIDGNFDNISCNSQIINLKQRRYSSMFILGCSEWGHQCEDIIINYQDLSEKSCLKISDLSSDTPAFGEIIIWRGKCMERKENAILENPWCKSANLFEQVILLDNTQILDSIQLPNCVNMHIFAITLY